MAWKQREDYFVQSMKDIPAKELRKEYTRFRKSFNAHLEAGFGKWYEQVAFRINPYPTIKEISEGKTADEANRAIMYYLSEMKNLSMSRGYTAQGRREMRKDAIDRLHALGATSVNSKNFDKFIEFADYFRDSYGIKYTSDALTVFDTVLKNDGDLSQMYDKFDQYIERIEEIEQIRKLPAKKQRKALKSIEMEID